MSFEEIAKQRGLTAAQNRLGELQWDVEADGALRLKFMSDIPFEGITLLMSRRGLAPSLVTYLFDRLAHRPFERALVAWDVARGSLLGESDAPLAARLATELAPLKSLGPPAAVAVPRDRLQAFMQAISAENSSATSDELASLPSLAGMLVASPDDSFIAAVNAHAKELAYAQLPSLALAFLQISWERFAAQSSLDLMLDLALDSGMPHCLPVLAGTDDRSIRQQAYVAIRANSYEYDVVTGARMLEELDKLPAVHGSQEPTLVLARAELSLLQNQPVDEASKTIIDAVGTSRSRHAKDGWRYAEFVKSALELHSGRDAASVMDSFVWKYGDHARLWGHAAHRADARAALLPVLSREVRFASHNPEVWRAVSIVVNDGLDIDNQLGERLLAQFVAAYA